MHIVLAYLDPGSASIVFQAVIAGIIAVPVHLPEQACRDAQEPSAAARTARSRRPSRSPTTTTDTPAR